MAPSSSRRMLRAASAAAAAAAAWLLTATASGGGGSAAAVPAAARTAPTGATAAATAATPDAGRQYIYSSYPRADYEGCDDGHGGGADGGDGGGPAPTVGGDLPDGVAASEEPDDLDGTAAPTEEGVVDGAGPSGEPEDLEATAAPDGPDGDDGLGAPPPVAVLPPPTPIPGADARTAGAACDGAAAACGDGLRCATPTDATTGRAAPGVCVRERPAGGACGTAGAVCAFGNLLCADDATDVPCGNDAACPSGAGTCRPPVSGDPCGHGGAATVTCSVDESLVCAAANAPTAAAVRRVCVPAVPPGGGGACTPGAADGCGLFSRTLEGYCVAGACADAAAAAATARRGDECPTRGGRCADGTTCVLINGEVGAARCAAVVGAAGGACDDAALDVCDTDGGLTCGAGGVCVAVSIPARALCEPAAGPPCAPGLSCVLTRTDPEVAFERDYRCLVPRAVGEACAAPADGCDAFAARCIRGVCAPVAERGVGDPCGGAAGGCVAGLACRGGVCVAATALGAACTGDEQCETAGTAVPYCGAPTPGGPRTCRVPAGLGGDCAAPGARCDGSLGLVCRGGTCGVPADAELAYRPCADDADCTGGGGGGGGVDVRRRPVQRPVLPHRVLEGAVTGAVVW